MIFIGITGGVGAGKSAILAYMEENYKCRVMRADEIAHQVMEPGGGCYGALRELFGAENVWLPDGRIDRPALAGVLFSNEKKRTALDALVHPAVKDYVRQQYAYETERGELDILVLEAALLIEENYGEICDELWYIYTAEGNRRGRLKASRGYSDGKIDSIFAAQLSEEEFRAGCNEEIDNNQSLDVTYRQLDMLLECRGIIPI
ncbi:MAG: dephospho-CoA kinase [Clostridiales bacterium]|nr:dephospho-CoA kinase [Clostridiales bacterium]